MTNNKGSNTIKNMGIKYMNKLDPRRLLLKSSLNTVNNSLSRLSTKNKTK